MAKYDLAPHENNARLDNLTLARKEGGSAS